jgi:hypothetical protein
MRQYSISYWTLLAKKAYQPFPESLVSRIMNASGLGDIKQRPFDSFAFCHLRQKVDVATASQLSGAPNSNRIKFVRAKKKERNQLFV